MSTRKNGTGPLLDDLGRALAGNLPRREALRRAGAALLAATIPGCSRDSSTLIGPGLGFTPSLGKGVSGENCVQYCTRAFPPGKAREKCIKDGAHHQGLCSSVIPFDSPDLHPLRIAGTDCQGFANRDAFIADLEAQFPDQSLPNGYPRNSTQGELIQFEGRAAFKIGELQSDFSLAKILVNGPKRMFMRGKVYVPPSPPGWLEPPDHIDGFSGQVNLGHISDGLNYNYYVGPATEISHPPGGFYALWSGSNISGPFWTANVQGKTSNWLILLEAGTSTTPIRARFWFNGGVALQDEKTDIIPSVTSWNLIEFQPSEAQHAADDPINNYFIMKLVEWTPWAPGTSCPYSGIVT